MSNQTISQIWQTLCRVVVVAHRVNSPSESTHHLMNRNRIYKMTILSSGGLSGASCASHLWMRLPDNNTVADRIRILEADSGIGSQYNACLARKFQGQGKHVDVSARFKCRNCDAYQEVDLIVDSELGESKAGNQSARKKQTLNYVEISRELFKNTPVTIYYQNHSRAIRDTPHVANWDAHARYEPCL